MKKRQRHAVDAFLDALDRPLAAEVQKLGRTMEEVVPTARRVERILQERPTSGMEHLMESMQSQIQILTKELAKAHESVAAKPQAATPTAAFAAPPSNTVAAAQPPPATLAPPRLSKPTATPLPPMATAQPPPYNPGSPQYVGYGDNRAPYFREQRRRSDRRPLRCFLCDEEGHVAYHCPSQTLLQRMLRQQAQEPARKPPRGQILAWSPKPKVAQIGCAVGPPILGQLTVEGIPVLGLVDTGASVTCMGFDVWWRYRTEWGALKQYEGTVCGAHGKPLNIAGRTEHLDIQWGEARGRASFIVIVGLESPPCLIGMDIMRPLRVHIDVTNGTATPAQPDPQTIHLNAAQSRQPQKRLPSQTTGPPLASQPLGENPSSGASLSIEGTADPSSIQPQRREIPLAGDRSSALPSPEIPPPATAGNLPSAPILPAPPYLANPHTASCAQLLQTADIPPETARLVRCYNPWPTEDVLFWPNDALLAFVTGIPALSSGPELWYAVHNHRPEPLQLHAGQSIGVLEVVNLAEAPASASASSHPSKPCQPPLPERLSPLQQQQLNELFKEYSDIFSQGEDDLGNTLLLEHAIETHGPPLRQPYRRQNPAVRREEMTQVQQMLSSNVIRPSNSPWASPVVMVRKKDGSLRFCVDFRQLNAATVKDAHPLPRIDDLLDALHGAKWFSTLDLKSGYWQVPLTEQDKAKTAFRTSSGQVFEFNQVPFGLCNAPATFSRLMDRVLAGLHWETCLFYLDDIIVFSSTWEKHLAQLREVFERLRPRQTQVGVRKVHFCRQGGQLPRP